jgi:hypothetical protein
LKLKNVLIYFTTILLIVVIFGYVTYQYYAPYRETPIVFKWTEWGTGYPRGTTVSSKGLVLKTTPRTFTLSAVVIGEEGEEYLTVQGEVYQAELKRGDIVRYTFNSSAPIFFKVHHGERLLVSLSNVTFIYRQMRIEESGTYTFDIWAQRPKPIPVVTLHIRLCNKIVNTLQGPNS